MDPKIKLCVECECYEYIEAGWICNDCLPIGGFMNFFCTKCGNQFSGSSAICRCGYEAIDLGLRLTTNEAKTLSNHLSNEYLTHEEPIRSVLQKIHSFADKNS